MKFWEKSWNNFKDALPHQKNPYSKRNWGNNLHSICSFQGKLKPSIAHHLVKIFVPEKGKLLDPFSGAGTIPFEGALQCKKTYAFELNESAFYITKAKLSVLSAKNINQVLLDLKKYIQSNKPTSKELEEAKEFGYNGKIVEYYHEKTLREIILARRFFNSFDEMDASTSFVMACMLHILHGNRPYALSRKSHPLTPYKPTGKFEYKPVIEKLGKKVRLAKKVSIPPGFCEGISYNIDSTTWWPPDVYDLDSIITSPPFFDSTRFYMNNWLRTWFSGWSKNDFERKTVNYLDDRQRNEGFNVYENIIRQSRERLKEDGILVFHLGKSDKCDMAKEILGIAKKWFGTHEIFTENVEHAEKHGVRDKGRVTEHSYLLLY